MRLAIVGVIALLVLLGGGWASASFTLTARVAEVIQAAPGLCRADRGGQLPTMEQLAHGLVALAEQQQLNASEVRITTEPLGASISV